MYGQLRCMAVSHAADVPRMALLASRALPMAWKCSFEKPGGNAAEVLCSAMLCLQAECEVVSCRWRWKCGEEEGKV